MTITELIAELEKHSDKDNTEVVIATEDGWGYSIITKVDDVVTQMENGKKIFISWIYK